MLDARFSHLYFQLFWPKIIYTLQRGLPAIAGLLVVISLVGNYF